MKKSMTTLLLLAVVISLPVSGCAWMGRTAGKAQAKLERKVNDMETGYQEGYEAEKESGSSPRTVEPEAAREAE